MSDIRPADSRFPEPRKEEGVRLPPTWPRDDIVESAGQPLPECDFSLVGHQLQGRRPFSVASLIFALLTLFVLGLAFNASSYGTAIFAILPAALGSALFLARRPAFSCSITSEGLEITQPFLTISNAQIQEISAPERVHSSESFPIQVFHTTGFFIIPDRLNVPSEDVYRFLVNQPLSVADDRTVPAALANFLRLQESLYGPGKVWVFRPRTALPSRQSNRYMVAIGLACLVTGLFWVLLGSASRAFAGWFAGGIVLAIIGFLMAVLFWFADLGDSRFKKLRQSCLVVSPGGIGLVQGHLKGELKWREVLGMKMRKKASFSVAGGQDHGRGLVLSVAGADIVVVDIYHRPLEHIFDRMRRFWAG